jgi:hypothetical protein
MKVYLMVEKIFIQKIESGGLGVRDKMDFMALLSQGFPQLCCDYPTPTESRIANDS